jgi:HTH-type transcriptional regulator/antitoxin HigA
MISKINNERQYETALAEIDRLFNAAPNTPDGDYLDSLFDLVESYEEAHHAIPEADPIAIIHYCLDSQSITWSELQEYLGPQAQMVLNRQFPLTLEMIRRLHKGAGIPAEVLIQPYQILQAA